MTSATTVLRSDVVASDIPAPSHTGVDDVNFHHQCSDGSTRWHSTGTTSTLIPSSSHHAQPSFWQSSNFNDIDPSSHLQVIHSQQRYHHQHPHLHDHDHATQLIPQHCHPVLNQVSPAHPLASTLTMHGQPLDMQSSTAAAAAMTSSDTLPAVAMTAVGHPVPSLLCVEQLHDQRQPSWSLPKHAWSAITDNLDASHDSTLAYARSSISSSTSSLSLAQSQSHTHSPESNMNTSYNHLTDLSLSQQGSATATLADDSSQRFSQTSGTVSAGPVTPEDTLRPQQYKAHIDQPAVMINGDLQHTQQWPLVMTNGEMDAANFMPITQHHFMQQTQDCQTYPIVTQLPPAQSAPTHLPQASDLQTTTAIQPVSWTQPAQPAQAAIQPVVVAAPVATQNASRCTSTLRPLAIPQLSGYMSEMIVYLWYSQPQPSALKASQTQVRFPKPSESFKRWCNDVLQTTQVSQSVVVLALFFIWKLLRNHRIPAPPGSEYVLSTIGLMLANKILDDHTYTNKTWSEVAGLPLSVLNQSEREFLQGLDYNLYVDKKNYERWEELLKAPTPEVLARNARPAARKRARFTNKNWAIAPSAPASPVHQPAAIPVPVPAAPASAVPATRTTKKSTRPAITRQQTVPNVSQSQQSLAPLILAPQVASSPGMVPCPAASASAGSSRGTKRKASDEHLSEQAMFEQGIFPTHLYDSFSIPSASQASTTAGQPQNIDFSALASTYSQPNVQPQGPLQYYELAAGQPGGGRLTSQPIVSGTTIPQYVYSMPVGDLANDPEFGNLSTLVMHTPPQSLAVPSTMHAHSARPQGLVSERQLADYNRARKALSLSPLEHHELLAQENAMYAGHAAYPPSAPTYNSAMIHSEPRLIMPMPIRAYTQHASKSLDAHHAMWTHQPMHYDAMMLANPQMYQYAMPTPMGSQFANNGPPAIWNWA